MAHIFKIQGRDDFYGKVGTGNRQYKRVRLSSDRGISTSWLVALQLAADRVAAGEPARMDTLRGIPRRILESLGLVSRLAEARGSTWADHAAAYVAELQRRGLSAKYTKNAGMYLAEVGKACGWRTLRDVTRPTWTKYLENRKASPRTLNNILATVRGFLGWAVENEYLDRDPLATVNTIDASEKTRVWRAFCDEEVTAILEHAGRYELAVRLALGTGLRRSEVRRLQWRDVNLGPRPCLRLRPEATKAKRGDVLPLPRPLAALLEARRPLEAAPTDRVTIPPTCDAWEGLLKRAGIPYTDAEGRIGGFHGLRKSYITALQRSGAAPRVVQALARHTDPRLTHGTYTDLSLLDTFGAVQALPTYAQPAVRALAEGTTNTPLVPWDHIRDQQVCKTVPQTCKSLQDCSANTPKGSGRKTQQNQAFSAVSGGNLYRSGGFSETPRVGLEPTTDPKLSVDTATTYDTSKTAGDHIGHQTGPENGTNEPTTAPTADALADLLRGLPADVVRAALEKLAGEVEK